MATKHEPEWHYLLKSSSPGYESPLVLNTVGMRLAPEVLVLELFREVFFEWGEREEGRQLEPQSVNPDSNTLFFTEREQDVLQCFRGRRKETSQSRSHDFFAPAYPQLAVGGWPRRKSDRVIKFFLFGGPLAEFLSGNSSLVDGELDLFTRAFLGHKAAKPNEPLLGKEIFSVALYENYKLFDVVVAKEKIRGLLTRPNIILSGTVDPLSKRIHDDFVAICRLEETIPRLQWIGILMTFLRLALSTWLLANTKMTILTRDWLIASLDEGRPATQQDVIDGIKNRYRGLFHPTETASQEIYQHVDAYMRARIELNILLKILAAHLPLEEKLLVIDGKGKEYISIHDLCFMASQVSASIKTAHGEIDAKKLVTREGELHSAWKNPRKKGQGKNIDEFLRVLRKAREGDDTGGYLLEKQTSGFRVFPGHQLVKTMVILAAEDKFNGFSADKLLVKDLENHLRSYGIEFGVVAGSRQCLIKSLSELGLLKGSPDAGDSAEVRLPYRMAKKGAA